MGVQKMAMELSTIFGEKSEPSTGGRLDADEKGVQTADTHGGRRWRREYRLTGARDGKVRLEMTDQKKPKFPAVSFLCLALLAGALFSPRLIEQTETSCAALGAQETRMLIGAVSDEGKRLIVAPRVASMVAASAANRSWYNCAIGYWVDRANPPPRLD